MDKYLLVDSHVKDSEFLDCARTLDMIYRDAQIGESSIPTEGEFNEIQQRKNWYNIGRQDPEARASTVAAVGKTSINLWKPDTVVDDENQKLVVFGDDFIGRATGKRRGGMGHDSALGEYISKLTYPQVIIFHKKFSKDNVEFTLFAIKTLSWYLGGYPVRWNADKIILVEKQVALRIFGQAPGVYCMKSKYCLTYAAYGLACGVTDPRMLKEYGKRELLRFRRPAIASVLQLRDGGETLMTLVEDQTTNVEEVQADEAGPSIIIEEVQDDEAEPSSKRARVDDQE